MQETFFIDRPIFTTEKVKDGEEFMAYATADSRLLKWSHKTMVLPAVGTKVMITMNGIGPAVVEGYFESVGYLGVMTKALDPPRWLRKQNQESVGDTSKPEWYRKGIGCEFGTEIEPYQRGDATKHAAKLKKLRAESKGTMWAGRY